ncbi:hypothetical protein B382_23928 [Stutzerimonas stutzeri B1SMN1]|nr:hypothetical protein B382_23928 [Stutzerimonas stutzeri B1SMN1]
MALKLSFRDNSEHESGFHVYRSDAPMDPRNLPKPYKDLGRNSSVVIDEDFGGIFDQRRYYRVAAYVKGGNRSVSEEAHAGYDGKSPTLNLDFASLQYAVAQGIGLDLSPRAFSDLITFTRASGGGRFNAQGQYEWLPANQPRLDFDPVTGEAKGLLIEEQRTNLAAYSERFTGGGWSNVGSMIELTHYAAISPDGLGRASQLKVVVAGQARLEVPVGSSGYTSGVPITGSVYAKAGTERYLFLSLYDVGGDYPAIYDLQTGEVTFAHSTVSASVVTVGNGWFRCIWTWTPTVTGSNRFKVGVTSSPTGIANGEVGDSLFVWGAQLEVGSFP